MTRIYNIASFELDASPKDYKPTNFLNHKHSLRFLLSQSYELNKKNIAKKEIVARELHGTLGVSHSTLNFISNFSFFAENESHPSKHIFMFRGQFIGTYSWENIRTMRVDCLVHTHNRLIQPGLIPSPLDELNTIHATLNAHPTICLFQ